MVAASSAAVHAVNAEPGPLGGLGLDSIPDDATREAALRQKVLQMERQLQVRGIEWGQSWVRVGRALFDRGRPITPSARTSVSLRLHLTRRSRATYVPRSRTHFGRTLPTRQDERAGNVRPK